MNTHANNQSATTINELEREIYELYDTVKHLKDSAKKIQKKSKDLNPKELSKQSFISLWGADDTKDIISEKQKDARMLSMQIKNILDSSLNELCKLNSKISEIEQKLSIYKKILSFINSDEDTECIEYKMTVHFGNEHLWKKEFPEDILKSIQSFQKSPSKEKKEALLKRISFLSTETVKVSQNSDSNDFSYHKKLLDDYNLEKEKIENIFSLKGILEVSKNILQELESYYI